MGSVEVVKTEDIESLEYVPGDVESKIYKEYEKDIIFEILKKLGRSKEIITNKIKEVLNEERLYSTGEASDILDINRSTISTWIKNLKDYIEPEMDRKSYKLNYEGLFKIRMISMLREDNQYTISKIKELTIDEEVINSEEEKEKPLNIRVKELEDSLSKMEKEMNLYRDIAKGFLSTLDPDTLLEIQTTEDPSKVIGKIKERFLPAPGLTKDEVENLLKTSQDSLNKSVNEKIEENTKVIREEMKTEWASATKEQMEELKNQYSKKTFWQRLLGK